MKYFLRKGAKNKILRLSALKKPLRTTSWQKPPQKGPCEREHGNSPHENRREEPLR